MAALEPPSALGAEHGAARRRIAAAALASGSFPGDAVEPPRADRVVAPLSRFYCRIMTRRRPAAAVSTLLLLATSACAQEAPVAAGGPGPERSTAKTTIMQTDAAKLAAALNAMALKLHERLGPSSICSPASIGLAMLMVLPGARGETAAEIERLLALPEDLRGERLHRAAHELIAALQTAGKGENPTQLRLVNDLWVQQGYAIEDAFQKTLTQQFDAGAHVVDFVGAAEAARATINAAVAKATNDRIPELVPADLITADTRLVLTNALWLRGSWLHPFREHATQPAPFTRADGSTVEVPLMHVVESFAYAEDERFQIVRMRLADGGVVCDVVLPKQGTDLGAAEAALIAGDYVGELAPETVKIALPRFTIDSRLRLKEVLQPLGVRLAFGPDADFSGIRKQRDLQIAEVVHQTWIAVDEKGVEAAAATAVVMKRTGAARPREPKVFQADRPFAFVLRHESGVVLFQARVDDPTARPL